MIANNTEIARLRTLWKVASSIADSAWRDYQEAPSSVGIRRFLVAVDAEIAAFDAYFARAREPFQEAGAR